MIRCQSKINGSRVSLLPLILKYIMFVWIIMVLFFRCSYPSKLKLEFHPEQLVVCNGVDSLYFQDIRSVNDKYLITAIDYSNGLFLVFTLPTIELIQQFDLNSIAGFEEKSRGITPSAFFFIIVILFSLLEIIQRFFY